MADRVLRIGMKGIDVGKLQATLNDKGAKLVVDSYFGPATDTAVRSFQSQSGLVSDGVVGPKTWAALNSSPPPLPIDGNRPTPRHKTLVEVDAAFDKGTAQWYQAAYLIMKFDSGYERTIEAAARRLLLYKESLYLPVERDRGIPWAMVGIIHNMECSCNPKGVLHNGELIVGTPRKTTLVPAGRGPFSNWHQAALDAIDIQSLWQVPNWSIGYMLRQCESFNGQGYLKYHRQENSPYLWAQTSINDGTGKYVRDGVYDPNANANTQTGSAAILRQLEIMGEFKVLYA